MCEGPSMISGPIPPDHTLSQNSLQTSRLCCYSTPNATHILERAREGWWGPCSNWRGSPSFPTPQSTSSWCVTTEKRTCVG
ncbi:hypothetical protein J4Q44_G00166430 [Coregonus suidteri]|uniref:Uncharacterized protein n=1 Tax=Coregonus suidteri TaxID=861788 RepID=A0AAN8QVU2_9TELE